MEPIAKLSLTGLAMIYLIAAVQACSKVRLEADRKEFLEILILNRP